MKLVDNPELESFEVREENPERCSTICGHKEGVKESWLKEIRKYAPYVFEVDKKADEDNEELRFYDVKEDFECDPISSSAENLPQKESAVTSVEPDDELNKTVIDKEETNKEVYFEARETLEAEEKEKASTTDIVDKTEDKMSRRTLTRTVEGKAGHHAARHWTCNLKWNTVKFFALIRHHLFSLPVTHQFQHTHTHT